MTRTFDFIVLGGSAGSLESILQLLRAVPERITAPIAVVVHMLPRQPSLLPGLIENVTARPVVEPEDKTPLAPGTIYVAPPSYHMLVERNRTIALSVDEPVQYSRPSIDVLFESVARAFGSGVAAVLLSGSNADGAEGLARIAERGGLAIVQSPATAQHTEMPSAGLRRVPSALSLGVAEIAGYLWGTRS